MSKINITIKNAKKIGMQFYVKEQLPYIITILTISRYRKKAYDDLSEHAKRK